MHIHSAARRRQEIQRILRETSVASQEELVALLGKHGIRVSQATLSRDLRELGVAKTPSGYILPAEFAGATVTDFIPRDLRETKLDHAIREFVLSAVAAGNLVVIRTAVAGAQPVASALDTASLAGVLGTIAGDDTIFVAMASPTAASAFTRHVQQLIGTSPSRRRTRA
jgi:transcriptional regulator of arginine metabolism